MEILDDIINTLDKIESDLGYQISNQDIDYLKCTISCNISNDNVYIEIEDLGFIIIYINNKEIGDSINDLYDYYSIEKYGC